MRLRRMAPGSYVYDHPRVGVKAYYRVERGWADPPGTDRRRQVWVLTLVNDREDADILSDHLTLGSARDEIKRLLARAPGPIDTKSAG